MTSKLFPERRTRSQIKLSDDILKVPEHSPMKNARNTVRKNSDSPSVMDSVDDSEDELLLSPNKQPKIQRSKRSVSPPKDEYDAGALEERSGRELKRMKWDLGEGDVKNPVKARLAKAGHARTNSEPDVGPSRKASRKRAGTASSSNKPNSTSNIPVPPVMRSPTGVPKKTRAQSVPLFPSFSSLPQLDLRNPPLSPIRARSPSRSPDKYHGLKVHLSPPKPSSSELPPLQVEALPDEPKAPMEVDEEPPTANLDAVMESIRDSVVPVSEVSAQPPKSPTPAVPPSVPSTEPPVTPAPGDPSLFISLSPLTPLPETPLPPKTTAVGNEDRYNAEEGWRFNPEKVGVIHIPLYLLFTPLYPRKLRLVCYSNRYHNQTLGNRRMCPLHQMSLTLQLQAKYPDLQWDHLHSPQPKLHLTMLLFRQLPKSRSSLR